MFLEYGDLVRSLVLVRPAVGLVCWRKDADLVQTMTGLSEALKQVSGDTRLMTVDAQGHDGEWVRTQLTERIQAADADRTWLLVSRIEEVLPTVAKVLNGTREQLGRLRGVIVFVRENRRGEFQRLCPDLMDWIGLRICLAYQLSPRLGLKEVSESLSRLESQYELPSDSFLANPDHVRSTSPHDAWLWSELLTIRSELSSSEASNS